MKKKIEILSDYALLGFIIISLVSIGYDIDRKFTGFMCGNVRIITDISDGTPMNHGQKSLEIELPNGESFNSWGGCHPHWYTDTKNSLPRWDGISCDIEKFNPKTGKYKSITESNPVSIEVRQ